MPRRELELVEVVRRGLDLLVVANVVAEAQEGVLDGRADLRDRGAVAAGGGLAGETPFERFPRQRAIELGALQRFVPAVERRLDRLARRIQCHAALTVADL